MKTSPTPIVLDLAKTSFALLWPGIVSLSPQRVAMAFRFGGSHEHASRHCRGTVVPVTRLLSGGNPERVVVFLDGPLLPNELPASFEWILSLAQPGPFYMSEAYNQRGEGYVHGRISFVPGSWDQLGGLAADKRLGLGKATMMACAFFGDHMHQDVLRYDYFNRHEPHDILRDAQYVVEYDRDFDALIVLFTPGHGPVSADVTERVMGVIEAERQGQT